MKSGRIVAYENMYFPTVRLQNKDLEACCWNFVNCWSTEFKKKNSFWGGKRIAWSGDNVSKTELLPLGVQKSIQNNNS